MQLKGIQRKMITVKTTDSKLFEEAYFIVRANTYECEEDMVSEAQKIIKSKISDEGKGRMNISFKKAVLFSFASFILGCFCTFLLSFIFFH